MRWALRTDMLAFSNGRSGGWDQMERREFISLIGSRIAWSLAASAQQTAKIPRIGYLATNFRINRHLYEAFLERLRELGYVDGRNLVIDYRDAEGQLDRLPALATELARLTVTST